MVPKRYLGNLQNKKLRCSKLYQLLKSSHSHVQLWRIEAEWCQLKIPRAKGLARLITKNETTPKQAYSTNLHFAKVFLYNTQDSLKTKQIRPDDLMTQKGRDWTGHVGSLQCLTWSQKSQLTHNRTNTKLEAFWYEGVNPKRGERKESVSIN